MKKLKRMLLIHWHNYEKELISFDMINFLTGKTAAGKSTIIDALQLVLLGDTTGSFFNKAANQKSARTLKSYLFGEMATTGTPDSGICGTGALPAMWLWNLRIRRKRASLPRGLSATATRTRALTPNGSSFTARDFGIPLRGPADPDAL